MTPEAAERDYLDELATRPAARAPATLSEIVSAEWAASGLDTLTGSLQPTEDAYEELLGKAESLAGRRMRMGVSVPVEERVDHIRFMTADLDAEKRRELEPLFDVRLNAAKKAQAIERDAGEVRAATYGLSGNGLAFLTGMARQVVDPVNLATIPIGGPLKGPVLKMLGREFLLNAGIQAVQEPVIQSNRARLELEAGWSQAAGNVLEAGAGAAGLAGFFRAAGAGLKYVRGRRPAPEQQLADWNGERSFIGYLDDEAATALDRGTAYPGRDSVAFGEAVNSARGVTGEFDIAAAAAARVRTEKTPPRSPLGPGDPIGFLSPDDADALARGRVYPRRDPAAFGEGDPAGAPGAGDFAIADAARARARTEKIPPRTPPEPNDEPRGFLSGEDAAIAERGRVYPQRDPVAFGEFDMAPAWRVMDDLAPEDFEAAARALERDQVVSDQIAELPPARSADAEAVAEARIAQERAIEDAATAMDQGAPVRRPAEPPRSEFSGLSTADLAARLDGDAGPSPFEDVIFDVLPPARVAQLRALEPPVRTDALSAAIDRATRADIYIEALPDDFRVSHWDGKTWHPAGFADNPAAMTDLQRQISEIVETVMALQVDARGNRTLPVDQFNSQFKRTWRGIRDIAAPDAPAALADLPMPAIKASGEIEPVPLNAPKARRGPAARDPETFSLFEFLARRGGLRPDPELDAILDGGRFVPGFGPLVRKSGMSLDRAREAAVEAGYFRDQGADRGGVTTSTVNDLLRAIDDESRGKRRYIEGRERGEAFDPVENRAFIEREIDNQLAEAEIDPKTIDAPLLERTREIMEKEGERDALVAFERAVMEDRDRYERAFKRRKQDEDLAEIPGWDIPDDAGATPQGRRASARDRSGDAAGGKAGGGETREPSRGAGEGDRDAPAAGNDLDQLGDPALAREAARILDDAGDLDITVKLPDGSFRTVSAREILREAEEEAAAARELIDCIGIKPEGA